MPNLADLWPPSLLHTAHTIWRISDSHGPQVVSQSRRVLDHVRPNCNLTSQFCLNVHHVAQGSQVSNSPEQISGTEVHPFK